MKSRQEHSGELRSRVDGSCLSDEFSFSVKLAAQTGCKKACNHNVLCTAAHLDSREDNSAVGMLQPGRDAFDDALSILGVLRLVAGQGVQDEDLCPQRMSQLCNVLTTIIALMTSSSRQSELGPFRPRQVALLYLAPIQT